MRFLTILSLFFLTSISAFAGGFILSGPEDIYWRPAEQAGGQYMKVFPDNFNPFQVELMSEEAEVTIENGIATTTITQSFYQSSNDTVQAYYLLPLPDGVQLDDFKMKMEDRTFRPEVWDKGRAFNVWDDMVRRTGDHRYWQYANQDLIKISMYQIAPRQTMRLEITYTQSLQSTTANGQKFVFPCSGLGLPKRPAGKFNLAVNLISDKQIVNFDSPTKELNVNVVDSKNIAATVNLARKGINEDVEFEFQTSEDMLGYSLQAYKTSGNTGSFVLSINAGIGQAAEVVHKHMTFLIDGSAQVSSAEFSSQKNAVQDCVGKLNSNDKFNVIVYGDEPKLLFDQPKEASAINLSAAKTFIGAQGQQTACNLDLALQKALSPEELKEHPFMLILFSGSKPDAGIKDRSSIIDMIERRSVKHRYIYPVGINDNSDTQLLDEMAMLTNGFSTYVLEGENVKSNVAKLYEEIGYPIFNNLQLYFTNGFRIPVSFPTTLPKLMFQGKPVILSGYYSTPGMAKMSLTGNVNGELKRVNFDVEFPGTIQREPLLPKLVATREVGYLLHKIRMEGDMSEDIADEIFDLAEEHNIINPYTTHLLIDDYQYLTDREKKDLPSVFTSGNDYTTEYESLSQASGQGAMTSAQDAWFYTRMSDVNDINKPFEKMGGKEANASGKEEKTCKFMGTTTICKQGDLWIDSNAETGSAEPQEVHYYSDKYFELVGADRSIVDFYALGERVKFKAGSQVYEIIEREPEEEEEEKK